MACPHMHEMARLETPRLSQSVHREECTQCFDNQDSPAGVEVCLSCFNGGCIDGSRHHARSHVMKSGHAFTLNVKRKLKPSARRADEEEPPAKMKKLAIVEDREEDRYEHLTALKCWKCDQQNGFEIPDASSDEKVKSLINGVMHSMSSARQSEVKQWEEEIIPCEHTLTLQQVETGHVAQTNSHCSKCDLKENLWLCLTCGSLGCGRQQFGGTGGNGHGLSHYQETQHPISVKLGTITAEGGADIYCYSCDDAKVDPAMAEHLATFGINFLTQTKTEKSMTELQIEQNLNYDFSLTGEDGSALEPVFGPGLTGLSNLGNSCYMASVMQTLFSLPAFQSRYQAPASHWESCREALPATCVDCQMFKLSDGLLSGRYSHPASPHFIATPKDLNPLAHDSPTPVFQEGIKPSAFKALIGKGHEEFATMKQQDAEEYLAHLISVIRRRAKAVGSDPKGEPTEVFAFGLEQRLQCRECSKVRYRTDQADVASVPVPAREEITDDEGKVTWGAVELDECLGQFTGAEALEYDCPSCAKKVIAIKQTKFASFPEVLVVHAKKFQLLNWVPTKLDIPLNVSDQLNLDAYFGGGLKPGESELPENGPGAPGALQFNEAAMAQLEGMGFPVIRCHKALLATGNNDPEAAMEWLFAHMEDADIDDPIPAPSTGGTAAAAGPEPTPDQISMLADMGFSAAQARKALRETGGNAERAVEWLFNHPEDQGDDSSASAAAAAPVLTTLAGSKELPANYRLKAFISHKGPSVHSGHYVAHIRTGDAWVLFNDEKVVKADAESVEQLKKLAYMYIYEKI